MFMTFWVTRIHMILLFKKMSVYGILKECAVVCVDFITGLGVQRSWVATL